MTKNTSRNKHEKLAFNLSEAAQIIGVSKPTMHRLLPEIHHRRVGRRVLIPLTSLEQWLEESEDK